MAEVRKRGDDFWKEFEFFLSDWAVGLVLDVALVTLITPAAVLGRQGMSNGTKKPNGTYCLCIVTPSSRMMFHAVLIQLLPLQPRRHHSAVPLPEHGAHCNV